MNFANWVEKRYPSFEDKLAAIESELRAAAKVVDIDYSSSRLAFGANKGKDVKTLTKESSGRCWVYINEVELSGQKFPQVVFLNMRSQYQSKTTRKSVPSCVNGCNILFEVFSGNKQIKPGKKVELNDSVVVDQTVLRNESRRLFDIYRPLQKNSDSQYFAKHGIDLDYLLSDPTVRHKEGFVRRYGRFEAIPLRYVQQDTFEGFQRIYNTGDKTMLEGFNPNGLCAYYATEIESLDPNNVTTVIGGEGVANALMHNKMSKEFGWSGVANIACLYEYNLLKVFESAKDKFPNAERFLIIYDNDTNGVGRRRAEQVAENEPYIQVAGYELNDVCKMVDAFGYDAAKAVFRRSVKEAFIKK